MTNEQYIIKLKACGLPSFLFVSVSLYVSFSISVSIPYLDWSRSISPPSIYSSVTPYTTTLLTVTARDTIISSNTIANTILPITDSIDSTITIVKLISTSITNTIELTSTIKSANITSNIQSIAVTTTIASNPLTTPNIEINSTKFAFTNIQSTNEMRTIRLTSTKSVSGTSIMKSVSGTSNMKSVNMIITTVLLTTSNIKVHSTKFSSTSIQTTSDASIISTESVRVTSTIIEFTFNQMSSSVVVLSSFIPSPLLESGVNKSELPTSLMYSIQNAK